MNLHPRSWHPVAWVAGGLAVVVVLVAVVVLSVGGGGTRTIKAEFTEAPGLYNGNNVEILGITAGTVTGIKPEPGYVLVTMQVSNKYKIPADATATLMAPQVVSDRFVQLDPSYTNGPTMPAGTVIPLNRTQIPVSVDEVINSLNSLAAQLGPNGANQHGALSSLVHQLATNFGPSGPDFHNAVTSFSHALNGLSQSAPALAGTINNLGALSQALANNSSVYQSFAANLDAVTNVLANDRTDISAITEQLQQLFANLTAFINADGSNLGASIGNLKTFAAELASDQQYLAQIYSVSPLSLQNLDNAVDKTAPGGAAIRGRYDPVAATQGLFNQVCGNAALRFLVLLATSTQTNPLTVSTPTDTLCGIGNALNALTPPPGAATGPNLTLQALAG
jgi:phospholipid/cholesterol/gamma-HCH transport system substrate-binding protein